MFVRAALAAAAGSFLGAPGRRRARRGASSFGQERPPASRWLRVWPSPGQPRATSAVHQRAGGGREAVAALGVVTEHVPARARGREQHRPRPRARARTPQPSPPRSRRRRRTGISAVEDRRDLVGGLADRDDPRQPVRRGCAAATGPRPSRGRRRSGRRRRRPRRSRRARRGRSWPSSCPRTGHASTSATTSPRCCSGVKLASAAAHRIRRDAERQRGGGGGRGVGAISGPFARRPARATRVPSIRDTRSPST